MPTQRLRSGCASCAVAYAQHGLCEATYYAKPPRASAEWMLAYAADGALKTKTLLTCSYASMTDILSKWAIPSWPATGHSAANRADSLWAWIRGTSTISLKATLKWTMYEMNLYVHIHLFMCSNPIFLWRKNTGFFMSIVGEPQSQWIVFPANSACRLIERTSAFKPSQSQSTAWTFISWEIKNWENRWHRYIMVYIIIIYGI